MDHILEDFFRKKNTNTMVGFALKRSAYQLYDINNCIKMLSNLFLIFDIILLDYEGINWEFSTSDLLKLEEFLNSLDKKKQLIYVIGTRANEWDLETNIGSIRGRKHIELSQRSKQLFICLSVRHKDYLTEQEKQKSSRKTIMEYENLLKTCNYQKCWYLAGDNIITITSNITREFTNVNIILLQSAKVFYEIMKLKDISLSRIGIYGLWIDNSIDDHAKSYLKRRGIKTIDINDENVKSYVLTLSKLNNAEYQNIGYVFFFSAALKEE